MQYRKGRHHLQKKLMSKVSIWLLSLLNLFIVILLTFMIGWRYWWTGKFFSSEVNAAFINGAFTFITVTATLGITAYFNHKTQKVAIQSSRSGLRDLIYQKRLEIYPKIRKHMNGIIGFYYKAHAKIFTLEEWKNEFFDNYHPLVDYIANDAYYISPRVKKALFNFWSHIHFYNSSYEDKIIIIDDEFTTRAEELATVVELYMQADLTLDEIEKDLSSIQQDAKVYLKRLDDKSFASGIVKDKKIAEQLIKDGYTLY
jgi:hypothetical protein